MGSFSIYRGVLYQHNLINNKKKILIVDGEAIVARGIKKSLEYDGFHVQAVIGGTEAISLAKKGFFDVILVDLIMSGLNGVETCKGIKAISPKTEVLLLSGFPQEIEKFQHSFIEAGGKDLFLRKPLMANEVKDAINKVLNIKNRISTTSAEI